MKRIKVIPMLPLLIMVVMVLLPAFASAASKAITIPKKITIGQGMTFLPDCEVNPSLDGRAQKWTCGNKNVLACREDGVITALKPGRTTLSVKIGKYSAKCAVTVDKSYEIMVDGVVVDKDFTPANSPIKLPSGAQMPTLTIQYTSRGEEHSAGALMGTFSWSDMNPDGTGTAIHADTDHPLYTVGMMPIVRNDDTSVIELRFSTPPTSYTVERWSDKYLSDPRKAYTQSPEEVNTADNAILPPSNGKGYVYIVHATWPDSSATYSFFITSKIK